MSKFVNSAPPPNPDPTPNPNSGQQALEQVRQVCGDARERRRRRLHRIQVDAERVPPTDGAAAGPRGGGARVGGRGRPHRQGAAGRRADDQQGHHRAAARGGTHTETRTVTSPAPNHHTFTLAPTPIPPLTQTLSLVQARGEPNQTFFQLFGFDVMFDAQIKPWLLEARTSPRPG